jgi:hypothetical protein
MRPLKKDMESKNISKGGRNVLSRRELVGHI